MDVILVITRKSQLIKSKLRTWEKSLEKSSSLLLVEEGGRKTQTSGKITTLQQQITRLDPQGIIYPSIQYIYGGNTLLVVLLFIHFFWGPVKCHESSKRPALVACNF